MTPVRQAGFTLLEVLVATVIFGILLTGLVQGTQFGVRAWTFQTHAAETRQDLDLVDRTMRRLIGTMDPGSRTGAEKFTGNAGSMGFTAAMPDALTAFGTRQADVVVSVSPAHVLLLRWAPHYGMLTGPPPAPHLTELLAGVERLDLSFYTSSQGWRADWQAAEGLPELVRMRIVFLPGDTRNWPPIVASVNTV